jgi:allophanate hydrolase subunit 1
VYPLVSPGGWNLIGRTPVKIFDIARAEPTLLGTGDRVRFRPITRAEFDEASA